MESENEIINLIKEGNKEKFGMLLERYRPKLFASALKILGHGEDANDAVQDTFLMAICKIHQLRSHSSFGGWLLKILQNNCRMTLRSRNKNAIEFPDLSPSTELNSYEVQLEKSIFSEALWSAYAFLPDHLQATALLRYFGTLNSYQEIAQILQTPVGTVKSRLTDVRKKLSLLIAVTSDNPARLWLNKTNERQQFYHEVLDNFTESSYRKIFFDSVPEHVEILFSSGSHGHGKSKIISTLCNGLETETKFYTKNVMSGGNITIVDLIFSNPVNSTNPCPPEGSFVFFHKKDRIQRVHLHYAPMQ